MMYETGFSSDGSFLNTWYEYAQTFLEERLTPHVMAWLGISAPSSPRLLFSAHLFDIAAASVFSSQRVVWPAYSYPLRSSNVRSTQSTTTNIVRGMSVPQDPVSQGWPAMFNMHTAWHEICT